MLSVLGIRMRRSDEQTCLHNFIANPRKHTGRSRARSPAFRQKNQFALDANVIRIMFRSVISGGAERREGGDEREGWAAGRNQNPELNQMEKQN